MYRYTEFDRLFVHQRAAQFRDQLERNIAGKLSDDEFRPLRLQNGWYIQRHAPMTRIAVPYGALAARQLRRLARIAREFDRGYAHFTTRQNCQFNWIELVRGADVMDLLAEVDMHGIQTSGNCIRNITSDGLAGVASDEFVDPRPYCEVMRQWSTLHPEFAFLPRKFKIAVSGAREDRAAIAWHDIGLQIVKNERGEIGFTVLVGGGMGRTPVVATQIRDFLPWQEILLYIEAIVRVYNRYGRRDNAFKARIKILVKAEGQKFIAAVEEEFRHILADDVDGTAHRIPEAELERVKASFVLPEGVSEQGAAPAFPHGASGAFARWLQRNVHAHRLPGYRAVTLSLKRAGQAPGDITADQMEAAAALAERYSHAELRVTHEQNLLLPWVHASDLPALYEAARRLGLAQANIGLVSDMIVCPGGDFCSLANARSLPIAAALTELFHDIDEITDLGPIDLHMSGCINSCGHHHSGHIGILGVDKDGKEWYQVTLGGSDGSALSGPATPGKVVGPSFSAAEVPDVVEAVLDTYRALRHSAAEAFIDTLRRVGHDPFKQAANAARHASSHRDLRVAEEAAA